MSICPKEEEPTVSCPRHYHKKKSNIFHLQETFIYQEASKKTSEKDSRFCKGILWVSTRTFYKVNTKEVNGNYFWQETNYYYQPIHTMIFTRFLLVQAGYNFPSWIIGYFIKIRFRHTKRIFTGKLSFKIAATIPQPLVQRISWFSAWDRSITALPILKTNNTINMEFSIVVRYNLNNFIGIGRDSRKHVASEKHEQTTRVDLYEMTNQLRYWPLQKTP
jgi:hypothetical protein